MQAAAMRFEPPFDEADRQILAKSWYPIALAREVGAGPVAAKLLDEPLVIYRAGGALIVARDACPHRGVPLTMASHDGEGVVCAYHGLRFGAGGVCTKVPAHPDMAIPEALRLNLLPAVERYGLIWTCLQADDGAEAAIPPMPHWDDEGFQQITCPSVDIGGFAGRQLEGFIDVAHFAFVHTSTFGDKNNTVVPLYTPAATNDGFEVEYRSSVGNYPIGVDGRGQAGFEWLRHFRVHLPFTATLTIHFPDDARLVIMNAASPVSTRMTRMFAPIARNFDTDLPIDDVYSFNLRVFEEDRAIVESQTPAALPLDPRREAHLPADRASLAYRKGLRGLGLGRFFAG